MIRCSVILRRDPIKIFCPINFNIFVVTLRSLRLLYQFVTYDHRFRSAAAREDYWILGVGEPATTCYYRDRVSYWKIQGDPRFTANLRCEDRRNSSPESIAAD